MLLLKNAKFIPFLTEGTDLTEGDVLIKDGVIDSIAPCIEPAEGTEVLDLAGKTLLPGLIDLHCHLFYKNMDCLFHGHDYSDSTVTLNCLTYAQEMLNDGYTTIRDVGDIHSRPAMYVKKAIEAGQFKGPRITTSGPIISSNWTKLDIIDTFTCGYNGFLDTCRKNYADGGDFVKLYGSGSLLMQSNEPGYPLLEQEEVEAAVLASKRNGSYVSVHAHGKTAIDICVKGGVHTIEHASMISEETLKYIEDNNLGTSLVFTMYAIDEVMGEPETYNGKRMNEIWGTIRASLTNAYKNHKSIMIGWGTDVGYDLFKTDPMHEFKLRKEMLEMENDDILRQATINSATIIGQQNKIGTVKAGKLADLIAVDGDPSADISVMYKIPCHVIKGGEVIR